MPKDIPGYHYCADTDGVLAIQADEPYEGAVTLTWRPDDFPGKSVDVIIPQALFAPAASSYIRELETRSVGSKAAKAAAGK